MSNSTHNFQFSRKRYGSGFQYYDATSLQKIACKKTLKSIKAITIPPMWNEVLLNLKKDTKIVAVGRDVKGRKQYIYSESWNLKQQTQKFNKLLEFANELPGIRKVCRSALTESTWSRQKVVALMVLILDETGIRIGNKRYSDENDSFGLSTLRRKHLLESDENGANDDDDAVTFDFTGKSGKHRKVFIDDPELAQHIKMSAQLPGYNVFRYQHSVSNKSDYNDISSDDVNEFIKTSMGSAYSCKDFRTWTGTCLAAEYYWETINDENVNKRKKIENIVIEKVAKKLGNTPAICREYYIHPTLLTKIENKQLSEAPLDPKSEDLCDLSALEKYVLAQIS